jgi:cell division protein ZapA
MKNRAVITVDNVNYNMVSADSIDHIKRVGEYVDKKLKDVKAASPLTPEKALLLTALNMADELFKTRAEITLLRQQMQKPVESVPSAPGVTGGKPDNAKGKQKQKR